MERIIAAARRFTHLVWYRLARASLERTDACSLFGLDLVIMPGVLHPRHFVSSRVLAEHVIGLDLCDKSVADLGTGSGIQALLAARMGARVTAIDVNPAALECASQNARRNNLADRLTMVASDVFDQLDEGVRFDLIITNPPFYPRAAAGASDQAFAAGPGNAFFVKLANSLPGRLEPGGALLMIQSSDTNFRPISQSLEARGMKGTVVRESRGLFESLTIREFKPTG